MIALIARFWPALAVLVVIAGAYQSGVNAERSRGEAATLRVQLETAIIDRDIARRSLIRVADDAAELATSARENEEQINALQEIIRTRADRGLSQSELDGLLGIK